MFRSSGNRVGDPVSVRTSTGLDAALTCDRLRAVAALYGTANERKYRRSRAASVPASQPPDQPMDLQPRPAKTQQQAQTQVAGFEVVHALRAMHIVQCANRLQFDGHHLLDQQIGDILSDNDAVIPHRRAAETTCQIAVARNCPIRMAYSAAARLDASTAARRASSSTAIACSRVTFAKKSLPA
jgi:hypothetical protein